MKNESAILKLRISLLCLIVFCIIGSYSLARPSIDSLFLQHYSSDSLPGVWLMSAITAAFVMTIYNRYNTRFSLLKILGVSALLSAFFLSLGIVAYQNDFSASIYLLYLWKEIYIVLLIETFWSFADLVFNLKSARWIYGIILACGSAGGFLGNLSVGYLATNLGTAATLWCILPAFMSCWLLTLLYTYITNDPSALKGTSKTIPKWWSSFKVVQKSSYLLPLLFLVATIQICISLIDYQFNSTLLFHYPDTDIRTGIIGNTHAAIDFIAVILQLATGPILRIIGVGGTLITIPIVLGTIASLFVLVPRYAMVFAIKIASKCFDYSIFRASKEMLYIPLEPEEKIQGKALIDILVYRIAKGLSSLVLLGLVYFGWTHFSMNLTLFLLMLWIILTYIIVTRYSLLTENKEASVN